MFLGSFRVDVEEEGVRTGDWLASRDDGEAVPSLLSLFFLEDLLESFPLESCDDYISKCATGAKTIKRERETYDSLAEAFHLAG